MKRKSAKIASDRRSAQKMRRLTERICIHERSPGARRMNLRLAEASDLGEVVRQKLAADEGGSVSGAQAARLLGISKATVLRRWRGHRMVGWSEGKMARFPVWQFAGSKMLRGIEDVLQIFQSDDQWRVMRYFLGKRHSLADRRPLDLLRRGKVAEVLAHAKAFATDNTW